MIMKWLTVELSPIPVDFGGEYMNRHPDFSCCAISNELYIDTAQYSPE